MAETEHDVFDLDRFVDAQDESYDQALRELRSGRKESHWMWWIFPQYAGLGISPTSQRFAIRSRAEAAAYLEHEALGARLMECMNTLLEHHGRTAFEIMGSPDDLKLRSCVTLFASVLPEDPVLSGVLKQYFDGQPDSRTLDLLSQEGSR